MRCVLLAVDDITVYEVLLPSCIMHRVGYVRAFCLYGAVRLICLVHLSAGAYFCLFCASCVSHRLPISRPCSEPSRSVPCLLKWR